MANDATSRPEINGAPPIIRTEMLVPVFAHAQMPGWPKQARGGAARYMPAAQAFGDEHPTDAHLAAYSLPGQPVRLTTDAPTSVPVPMVLAVFDIDDPARKEHEAKQASDGFREAEATKVAALLRQHPGGYVYDTKGGYRIVYRLAEPYVLSSTDDGERWKVRYLQWAAYLFRAFGILVDPACFDWTRLYRLPRATRIDGGLPEDRPTIGDPAAIGTWAPPLDLAADVGTANQLAADERARVANAWRAKAKLLEKALADTLPARPAPRGTAPQPARRSTADKRLARAKAWLAKRDPAVSGGGGHARLMRTATALVRGFELSDDEALALLEQHYNPTCRPPWSRPELEHKVSEARQRGDMPFGALLNQTGERASSPPSRDERAPSKDEALLAILETCGIFRASNGSGGHFADTGRGGAVSVDDEDFRARVASRFHAKTGSLVAPAKIDAGLLAIKGRDGLPRREVHMRIAPHAGGVVLDLCDGEGHVAIVDQAGVKVTSESPVTFVRPDANAPLPLPVLPRDERECAAVIGELRHLLAIEDPSAWATSLAWLMAVLRGRGPFPLLNIRGEQASGKSTLARLLTGLVAPHRASNLIALPETPRDLAATVGSRAVLGFDNLSRLDRHMSDALCRLADGTAHEARKLYTDSAAATVAVARPVITTSIVDAVLAGDLLSRALMVTLPPRGEMFDVSDIDARFAALLPRALGALLYAAHFALRHRESVTVCGVRMIDAARFATAAEPALGLPAGAILAAFRTARSTAVAIDAESDVALAIEACFPANTDEWRLDMTALAQQLGIWATASTGTGRSPRGWPDDSRGLRSELERIKPSMRARGITIEFSEKKDPNTRRRVVVLTRVPSAAEPPAPPASSTRPVDEPPASGVVARPSAPPEAPPTLRPAPEASSSPQGAPVAYFDPFTGEVVS